MIDGVFVDHLDDVGMKIGSDSLSSSEVESFEAYLLYLIFDVFFSLLTLYRFIHTCFVSHRLRKLERAVVRKVDDPSQPLINGDQPYISVRDYQSQRADLKPKMAFFGLTFLTCFRLQSFSPLHAQR